MFNYLVKDAKYVRDYRVWLAFADGKSGEIDLTKKLKNRGGVFTPLQDVNYFKNFKIVGSTIAWENGADIAPESLYELLIQQNQKD
jgi:hypothetical protein